MKDLVGKIEIPKIEVPTLHGYVEIITKTKHGLVERTKGENTFQASVLAKVLDRNGELGLPMLNSYTDSVGGILLFDKAIPANSEFMPAGTKMVGHGYRGCTTQGTYPLLGTYNSSESSTSSDAITQVYDYATNQANGTIRAVSLTSYKGGVIGYGLGGSAPFTAQTLNDYYGSNIGSNARGAYYNGYCYRCLGVSDNILTIQKTPVNIGIGNIFRGLAKTLTFDLTEIGTPKYADDYWNIMGYVEAGKFRFWSQKYGYTAEAISVANGETIYYYEFDATTDTLSQGTFTNTSGETLRLENYGVQFLGDKCIIASANDGGATTDVYIFDVDNDTFVRKLTSMGNFSMYNGESALYYLPGEITDNYFTLVGMSNNSSYALIYDAIADSAERINLTGNNGGDTFGRMQIMRGVNSLALRGFGRSRSTDYGFAAKNPWYLATIYNLSTAVTKDASMTMKVIYTLTEA